MAKKTKSEPRKIIMQRLFTGEGDWTALRLAQEFVKSEGYTYGFMSSPLPFALVKGDYDSTPLPWKWKNFKKHHAKCIDGTMSGDYRSGPVKVVLYGPTNTTEG